MILVSLHKHHRSIEKCNFQGIQTIQFRCKNWFLGFHMSYCNILSNIREIEKANSSNHHLPEEAFMERQCSSCSKWENSRSILFEIMLTKKVVQFALRNQKHGAPFAKLVFVWSHVLKLFIWTNKKFLSSLYEF